MVRRLVSAALLGVSAWCAACAGAACAGATWAASSRPTITIMSPANSAVHYGTSITMRVAVKNFMLLPPRLRNPPPLKGDRGHIHYVLDDMSSFVPSRDMTVQLSHTWTDVPPGRHVLIAYLATSQHLQFPGTPRASVTVYLRPVPVRAQRPIPAAHRRSAQRPGIGSAPKTGGGGGLEGVTASPPYDPQLVLLALFLIAVGLLLVGRGVAPMRMRGSQVAFQTSGGPLPPEPPDRPALEGASSEESAAPREGPEAEPEPLPDLTLPTGAPEPAQAAPTPAPPASPSQSAPGSDSLDLTRARVAAMAEQWSSVVQDLVHQLDRYEEERRELLSRIDALQEAVHAHESLREAVVEAELEPVSSEDMQAVEYVTDSLLKDPDHIVVLAAVAQHADRLARIVQNYARVRRVLGDR